MSFYTGSVNTTEAGTAADIFTILAAAARKYLVHEVSISGLGTASAATELALRRVGTLGVTPTAFTMDEVDMDGGAFAGTASTAFATAPVVSGNPMLRLGCNMNGGVYRWVAKPGEEFLFRDNVAAGQSSFRFTTAAAGNKAFHCVVEEF